MVTIACVLLAAAAQGAVVDVVAPADPAITVTRLVSEPPANQFMAMLSNNTYRAIVGIAVIWQPERGHQYTVQSDSFNSMTKALIVPARGQIILTPDGFYRVDLSAGVRPATPHPELDAATRVTINLDAIIFDDGLVLGPNSSSLDKGIEDRTEALARVLQIVQIARAEGQDITAALRNMMPPPGTNLALLPLDALRDWIIFYAGELLRFPARRDYRLSELEKFPKPPTFYRR